MSNDPPDTPTRTGQGSKPDAIALAPDSIRRNTAFALVTQLATSALTAGLTLFLVRALGASEYGVYALAFAIGGVLLLPTDLGISPATSRLVAERRDDRDAVAAVFLDALRIKLVVSCAVAIALAASAGPLAGLYDEPELVWPLRAFAVVLLGLSIARLASGAYVGVGRIALNFRVSVVAGVLEAASTLALVLLGAGAAGAAFGRAIGWSVGAVLAVVVMFRFLGRTSVRAARRRPPAPWTIARYAGALALVDITYSLFDQIDALLIGAFMSAEAVGQFQAPMRLIVFLHLPGLAIASAVAPRLARQTRQEPDVAAFRTALRLVILLQATLVAPLLIWAEPIVRLLLGSEFDDSVLVLRGLTAYVFLLGLAPLVSLTANYLGYARRRIPIALGALLANALVTVALLPSLGLSAAVIGTTLGFLIYVPAHAHLCSRALGVSLRPALVTLGRCSLAGAAMAGVLVVAGTESLGLVGGVLGAAGGLLAYGATLALTRELTAADVAAVRGALPRRSRPTG